MNDTLKWKSAHQPPKQSQYLEEFSSEYLGHCPTSSEGKFFIVRYWYLGALWQEVNGGITIYISRYMGIPDEME